MPRWIVAQRARGFIAGMALAFALVLSMGADDCGAAPTTATNATQRKVPFFNILVFEWLKSSTGGVTQVWLFQDEAGNCYITSGEDGGVNVAPLSACEKAKHPNLEAK